MVDFKHIPSKSCLKSYSWGTFALTYICLGVRKNKTGFKGYFIDAALHFFGECSAGPMGEAAGKAHKGAR